MIARGKQGKTIVLIIHLIIIIIIYLDLLYLLNIKPIVL